ncbi:hypothetical protein MMC08_001734 [Hypocenomyce scalaris]|nr:hypothetical protein [Hypocenomyce scalaris]
MASALIMFMMMKKFKEAVDFAEKAMIDFSADPNRSAYEFSIARFLVISSMQGCYATIKAESEETARLLRTKQLKWLLEDTNSLRLQQSTEMLLLRVTAEPDEVTGGSAEAIAEIESAVEGISIEPPPLPAALLSAHLLENSSQLAVSDIFTLNLSKNHPFVCSIACDSGLQDVAAGDEPLGLVTALFCAGASSVLGTLWPIRSSTGRRFTKVFYESIERQRRVEEERDSKVKVLNLVAAVREASLEVKKEMGDPYSWAAFILHGAISMSCNGGYDLEDF